MSFVKLTASSLAIAALSATAGYARDNVQIKGSSTVLPYATIVAEAFGETTHLTGHWLPSFSGYLACCLNGAGWGLMPTASVEKHLSDGNLVELVPGARVTVKLHWQSSAQGSEIMKLLTNIVTDVARIHLIT